MSYRDGRENVAILGRTNERNFVASWRATEFLRRLSVIQKTTLDNAYLAGFRGQKISAWRLPANPVVREVGHKAYREIMSLPVPEKIVNSILLCYNTGLEPAFYPIVEEVRAGTIKWRQEFVEAGIRHPDEIDAAERAKKLLVNRMNWLISSYACRRSVHRHSAEICLLEDYLFALMNNGIGNHEPDHVVVALAGVVARLASAESSVMGMFIAILDSEAYELKMRMEKDRAISAAAKWLFSEDLLAPSVLCHFLFWKPQLRWFRLGDAMLLLARLLDEYFPPCKADPNT